MKKEAFLCKDFIQNTTNLLVAVGKTITIF